MEILSYDPVTGITMYHDYDDVTDTTTVHTVQDCEPILENNKILQNLDDRGWDKEKFFRRAALIPNILIEKWKNEEGIDVFNDDHWPAVRRKLNSNEYRHLRTAFWNV